MKKWLVVMLCCLFFAGCSSYLTPADIQGIADKVNNVNSEADKVQGQAVLVADAVKSTKLTGDQIQDWIAIAQATNTATTPFNPYAIPIAGVLAVLSSILGVFYKKKSTALNEVTMGNEAFKLIADAKALAEFKTAQTMNQSESTTKQVESIIA